MVVKIRKTTQFYKCDKFLLKALSANRESKYIEFKEKFDTQSNKDWCEIIKDIVALANSGGGYILIGLFNNGQPSKYDVSSVLALDLAVLTDKIYSYTGEHFFGFSIQSSRKRRYEIAVIKIDPSFVPLVFQKPGTYAVADGKQERAFSQGTVYFRHGAKSETATTGDLRQAILKEVQRIRKTWFGNIRKVVNAPSGYSVKLLPPNVVESSDPNATPIRIVDDPSAPSYKRANFDEIYPYRQKDLVDFINSRIKEKQQIGSYDIQCVRKIHKIDINPTYFYKPKFSSPQYSTAFATWLLEQFNGNRDFFHKARQSLKHIDN